MIFRKKTIQNDAKLEMKSEHELASLNGMSSIFKNPSSESEIITFALDQLPAEKPIEKSILVPESDLPKPSTSKAVRLIQEVQKLEDRTIKPFVDYNEGHVFYPTLSKIGEVQDNIEYLDGLVTDGILEQKIYEKLIVCPIHPDTFSSSIRLYCTTCHSLNVEKLNLFEHKKCGYITENSNFDFSDQKLME